MRKKILKFKSGFSLIEALIAIAILIVGILSAFLLLIRTTATIPAMQERLKAVNLAQEGIELVRALRDSDFINGSFKDFLKNCPRGICQIAVNSEGGIDLFPDEGKPLNFDEDTHLYTYVSGSLSNFSRQITIVDNLNYLNVTVEVKYNVRGKEQTIMATDRLYNWLNL